jgi:hypothetical protein
VTLLFVLAGCVSGTARIEPGEQGGIHGQLSLWGRNKPLAGTRVRLQAIGRGILSETHTDDDGIFEFFGCGPGLWLVSAHTVDPGGRTIRGYERIEVQRGFVTGVQLRLIPPEARFRPADGDGDWFQPTPLTRIHLLDTPLNPWRANLRAALAFLASPGSPEWDSKWLDDLKGSGRFPLIISPTNALIVTQATHPVSLVFPTFSNMGSAFVRKPGSRLWLRQVTAPQDALFTYKVMDIAGDHADPTNPPDPPLAGHGDSRIVMPGCRPRFMQLLRRPDRPAWRIETLVFRTNVDGFEYEKKFQILSPLDFDPARGPYRFAMLFKGPEHLANAITNLLANDHRLSPCVVALAINHNTWGAFESQPTSVMAPEERSNYTAWLSRTRKDPPPQAFRLPEIQAEMIIRQLVPVLEKRYNISRRREDRIVAGPWDEALNAWHLAIHYPEHFGAAGMQSPRGFNSRWVLTGLPPLPCRVWLDDGKHTGNTPDPEAWKTRCETILAGTKCHSRIVLHPGVANPPDWAMALPDMLAWLWGLESN